MKATVLVDNIKSEIAKGEWGLSIYIEYKEKKILLDTGGSALFLKNAQIYGKKIEEVDFAVLSHGHTDHSKRMTAFFENNRTANLYLQKACCTPSYFKKWIFRKYIGIQKKVLTDWDDRLVFVSDMEEIEDGVYLLPHNTKNLEEVGRKNSMYVKVDGRFLPDGFKHEQSLVFDTENGLVIFSSCSHGGPANIIREVQEAFPNKKIEAFVGGFHTAACPENEVRKLAKELIAAKVEKIYTGHCTGNKSYRILKEELGDKIQQMKVGMELSF